MKFGIQGEQSIGFVDIEFWWFLSKNLNIQWAFD